MQCSKFINASIRSHAPVVQYLSLDLRSQKATRFEIDTTKFIMDTKSLHRFHGMGKFIKRIKHFEFSALNDFASDIKETLEAFLDKFDLQSVNQVSLHGYVYLEMPKVWDILPRTTIEYIHFGCCFMYDIPKNFSLPNVRVIYASEIDVSELHLICPKPKKLFLLGCRGYLTKFRDYDFILHVAPTHTSVEHKESDCYFELTESPGGCSFPSTPAYNCFNPEFVNITISEETTPEIWKPTNLARVKKFIESFNHLRTIEFATSNDLVKLGSLRIPEIVSFLNVDSDHFTIHIESWVTRRSWVTDIDAICNALDAKFHKFWFTICVVKDFDPELKELRKRDDMHIVKMDVDGCYFQHLIVSKNASVLDRYQEWVDWEDRKETSQSTIQVARDAVERRMIVLKNQIASKLQNLLKHS